MKKTNRCICIGTLCCATTVLLNHFIALPEIVSGLGLGTGIGLELIGAYSINHDMSKLKNYKINFLEKTFSK